MRSVSERRIIVVQPALPAYRLDFFDRLATSLGPLFRVYASRSEMSGLSIRQTPPWLNTLDQMRNPIRGMEWQPGAISIAIRRGDILIVCGAPRCLSTLALMIKARLIGAKTVWWGHYWSATSIAWRHRFRLLSMRLADAVLFYTDQEVEAYRQKESRHDGRVISALNNGINVAPIKPLRLPYDAGMRPNRLLFIGRLTEKARLDLLLGALADPHLSGVDLQVIGDGPNAATLKAQADALGLDARVTWHGAQTDEAQVAAIANTCRLFVYPGAVGLSLLHAAAYGLPAIVHKDRATHMPEIAAFEGGRTGGAFSKGVVASLVETITDALSSTQVLNRWSAAAMQKADEEFNTEQMAARFLTLMAKLAPLPDAKPAEVCNG
ncbi:glycosyltransferase family 4 protein [Aliiroseovarius sp. YM-037]|uniref:glycosyltransferase family 4 protein n=1 Tax=Aliiroseovarius sp. YM-037 TaxID=3341728 RepID=UPI003A7F6B1B